MSSNVLEGLKPLLSPISWIHQLPGNARQGDVEAVAKSLEKFSQHKPLVVRRTGEEDGHMVGEILIGNHTYLAALSLGWDEVAVVWVDEDATTGKARALVDNRASELGGFDQDLLAELLADVYEADAALLDSISYTQDDLVALLEATAAPEDLVLDVAEEKISTPPADWDPRGQLVIPTKSKLSLFDRFLAPPFTVLNARDFWWQERKRSWVSLGLEGELGRDDKPRTWYIGAPGHDPQGAVPLGSADRRKAGEDDSGDLLYGEGSTSIFDPVLCELAYRWWCPQGGKVIDPFAGGSVRGVVAAKLGRHYVGTELRQVQVSANELQRDALLGDGEAIVPDVPEDNLPEVTPVEFLPESGVWLKREDLYTFAGVRGAKVRACMAFIQRAKDAGVGVVTAGARQSPQVNFVAQIANRLGVRCRVHVPTGELTPELLSAKAAGATVVQHEFGYNSVIMARAREDAEARGWLEIPYGMESQESVDFTMPQVANIPEGVLRIVNAVGSGMTLAGLLHGLVLSNRSIPVLAVCVGHVPEKRLDEWAPKNWRDLVEIVDLETPYETAAPVTTYQGVLLDAFYEAKCVPYLQEGDLLWVSAIRPSAVPAVAPDPIWYCGDAREIWDRLVNQEADFVLTCHPADTMVTGDKGLVPIQLVGPGDVVVSHLGERRVVTEALRFNYSGPLLTLVREYSSIPLRATPDHPFLVSRGDDLLWLRASEVRVGDSLVEPVPQAPLKPIDGELVWEFDYSKPDPASNRGRPFQGASSLTASTATCRLLGYYLAEGSCGRGTVQFAFNADEVEYHADVMDLYQQVFGGDLSTSLNRWGEGKQSSVNCSGIVGVSFFTDSCGRGAANKAFPSWVWECSDDLLTEVLVGLWRGDGWVESNGRMGFGSISHQLVEDVRRALLRLGVLSSIRCREDRKSNYCESPSPFWCLVVRGVHVDRLSGLLREQVPSPPHRRPGRGPWIDGGYAHYRVGSVEIEMVESLDVFNLEVEGDHSYLAEGVASHNCPPYGDLEVYSDDPLDLSTMGYFDFIETLTDIMTSCFRHLKDNSFACVVVGDFRDNDGYLHNFPGDFVQLMNDAGFHYLNEAILVTSLASLPLRASRGFTSTRKLGKTHQNVVVFCKGDAKRAAERCGPVVAPGMYGGDDD